MGIFVSFVGEDSGGFQREIHMYGIKRKFYKTLVGLLQYAGFQKRVHVSMNRFYVASPSVCCLTNRYWSPTGVMVRIPRPPTIRIIPFPILVGVILLSRHLTERRDPACAVAEGLSGESGWRSHRPGPRLRHQL